MTTMSELNQHSDSQEAQEHSEGKVARTIEEQTAKLPSDLWLWAAFAAIGGAMILHSVQRSLTRPDHIGPVTAGRRERQPHQSPRERTPQDCRHQTGWLHPGSGPPVSVHAWVIM